MRRSRKGSIALLLIIATAWHPAPALAQTQPAPAVALTLVGQSAWNAPGRPLDMTIRAVNHGDAPLQNLSIILSILAPARARSVYELSLRADATITIFTTSFQQEGSLAPEQTRNFRLRQPLGFLAARHETALYPVKVVLASGDAPVATLRSPMIFLNERQVLALNLAWTWVLSAPVQFRPDGVFLPGSLERDIAPGGTLEAMSRALQRLGPGGVDLAASSVLIGELIRMAHGYRISNPDGSTQTVSEGTAGAADAARVLSALRAVAARPATEVIALPFGDPSLPSLARSGLIHDLPSLLEGGRKLVTSALGASPSSTVSRPPLSQLDPGTLARLAALGTRTVLLDADSLPPSSSPLNNPPVVKLAAGRSMVAAVAPDPGVAAVAAAYPEDPRLAAQAALGDLAAIWRELPGTPGRGVAVLFSEQSALPGAFFAAFAGLVRSSPWLSPGTASRLVATAEPPGHQSLALRPYPALSPVLVGQLQSARASLGQFRQSAAGSSPQADRMEDNLRLSEGSVSLTDPSLGLQFVDSVSRTIRRTYGQVRITSSLVTLASQSGVIPVTIGNDSPYALRADILLTADRRIAFLGGNQRTVTLQRRTQVFTFPVRAQSTGRFPVKVQVLTSSAAPAETITEADMVVRSTAYNRFALFLTIGAALFLMGWWGRRFLPRRKS